ncbi:MAG: phosphoribosylglycinamide formyltransferase, partial [Fusobacteriaceae bacterium]|nr:phosphoribosylglycinamide formyltransferase [Fusobacteriaceae bacterium]
MVKVAVFASGTGSNFEKLVTYEKENKNCSYNIAILITDIESAKVIAKAKKLGIVTYFVNPKNFDTKEDFENKIVEILNLHNIELIALAGYMRILSKTLLNSYPNKIINIHPSLLPKYPGKSGIADAFMDKAEKTGVTIHYVDSGIDTGKIITQEELAIEPNWSMDELEESIHKIEHR